MANFGKEGKPEPVIAKLSQETLAEMIGTTRSRVSAFMKKFRKLEFIEYNGDLKVHNSLLNMVLHDAPGLRRETEDAQSIFRAACIKQHSPPSLPPTRINGPSAPLPPGHADG
jgi:hypothetical protein